MNMRHKSDIILFGLNRKGKKMFSRRLASVFVPRINAMVNRVNVSPSLMSKALAPSSKSFSSIKDMFTNYANNKMNETKEKQFQKMVDTMVSADKWTFRKWKGLLEEQLNSWTMYIPGVSSSKDAESIKELKAILDVMTDEELDDPSKVNGAARDRIAKASGKPIEQVRSLIFLHKNTLFYHLVLKMRKENGDPMPTSPGEMTKFFEEDARVKPIYQKVFMSDTKVRGRGMRRMR